MFQALLTASLLYSITGLYSGYANPLYPRMRLCHPQCIVYVSQYPNNKGTNYYTVYLNLKCADFISTSLIPSETSFQRGQRDIWICCMQADGKFIECLKGCAKKPYYL